MKSDTTLCEKRDFFLVFSNHFVLISIDVNTKFGITWPGTMKSATRILHYAERDNF
jgi:hypothetical protein